MQYKHAGCNCKKDSNNFQKEKKKKKTNNRKRKETKLYTGPIWGWMQY